MEDVIYIWSETREGSTATEFLQEFKGVLVSDFYSAYDSVDCPQQRCLIHLMRDFNDDIHQEPFNLEIKEVVQDFATLLKPIIETIDRFGLKARFLKKHKLAVTRFYDALLDRKYKTELAQKAQERFKRNRARLFTFLDYDNVPWNNNNAEHAIKAFADLRTVIDGPTPILLTHTPARCRVIPVAGIKLGIGRRLCVASDAEQRTEGVERVEAPVEPKREFVEVGL